MSFLAGIVIALVVSLSATVVGFDKDRVFYPTVLAVIASYYGLFAVMSGSAQAILAESFAIAGFLGAAVLGFKRGLWVVVAALLAHGIFDFFHGRFISSSGVPVWWPMFCLAYDVTAGIYLAWLLYRQELSNRLTK